MNEISQHTRRIIIASAIYIGCVFSLAMCGIIGNTNERAMQEALRYFPNETIIAGRRYFIYGIIPSTVVQLINFCCIIALIRHHTAVVYFLKRKIQSEYLQLFVFILLFFLAISLISFPFAVISGYFRKKLFGVLEGSFWLWLYRFGLHSCMRIIIISAVFFLFLVIVRRLKHYRIIIPVLFCSFLLGGILIYPRHIIPLTHQREFLYNESLKQKIEKLFSKAHIPVHSMYILNESKYSKHVNAFFTGWGPYREIYLFDTLINNYNEDEVLVIIAHELCHYCEEHVVIGCCLAALGIFIFMCFFDRFSIWLYNKKLVELASEMRIGAILLIVAIVLFFMQPIKNSISRTMERRCDAYACKVIGNTSMVIDVERKIAMINRKDLLPHTLYHFWYSSHPSSLERISIAQQCK